MPASAALAGAIAAAACADPTAPPPSPGPVARHVERVAAARGVPRDLVLAVAAVEGGLELPARREVHADDLVPVAGVMELRHGAFDSLARGAAIAGVAEEVLRADTDLGTEAGVGVLAEIGAAAGARPGDLAGWRDAVARLGGHASTAQADDYAARVYRTLRRGGLFPARDGEVVWIPAHPEVPPSMTMAPPLKHTLATPEFPGAIWFQTSCNNKCGTTRSQTVDAIVIHDTEGGWDASVATLQNDPGKSVHYIVDKDGSKVGQFIPESYDGWHAGNSCWNNRSVGIEHVGYAADKAGYAKGLYDKSVALVKSIRTRHKIPLDRKQIVGHYQVPDPNTMGQCVPACSAGLDACETDAKNGKNWGGASHHWDPGWYWQWCQYMESLGGTCDCKDAWPLWNCTTDKTEAWRCNGGKLEKKDCTAGCTVMPNGQDDECKGAPADAGAGGSGGGGAGTGGSAGAGAGAGAGGAAGAGAGGGAGAGAGAGGGAGAGTGGAAGTGGTAGGGAWGGSVGDDAGVGPAAGAGAAPASGEAGDGGGCSCRTGGREGGGQSAIAIGAMALGAALRRRRRAGPPGPPGMR